MNLNDSSEKQTRRTIDQIKVESVYSSSEEDKEDARLNGSILSNNSLITENHDDQNKSRSKTDLKLREQKSHPAGDPSVIFNMPSKYTTTFSLCHISF